MTELPDGCTEYRTYILGKPIEHTPIWQVQITGGRQTRVPTLAPFEFGTGATPDEALAAARLIVDNVILDGKP